MISIQGVGAKHCTEDGLKLVFKHLEELDYKPDGRENGDLKVHLYANLTEKDYRVAKLYEERTKQNEELIYNLLNITHFLDIPKLFQIYLTIIGTWYLYGEREAPELNEEFKIPL